MGFGLFVLTTRDVAPRNGGGLCAVVVLNWLGVEGSGNVQQPCGFGESEVSIIASARSGIVAWVTGLTWAILASAELVCTSITLLLIFTEYIFFFF